MTTSEKIPVPVSISPEAQAFLSIGPLAHEPFPALDDHDAWRHRIAQMDERMALMSQVPDSVHVEDIAIDGVTCYDIRPKSVAECGDGIILDIHGGALIAGKGAFARASASSLAERLGRRVIAIDYRLPPDHPYPAGLDDCLAVYAAMLREFSPGKIILHGSSAGGNLAAAAILRARDEGLPLPGGVILQTPELDLTHSGDSFQTNKYLDMLLSADLMPANLLYANGVDLSHPYLSPLFGDFSKGFPPTFLSTGTRDLFLSNTVRMHWALLNAHIRAELFVVDAGPHGGFPFAPEGRALDEQVRRFVKSILLNPEPQEAPRRR